LKKCLGKIRIRKYKNEVLENKKAVLYEYCFYNTISKELL